MKVNPMKFVSASLPVNKFKNRLVNILPCEFLSLFSVETLGWLCLYRRCVRFVECSSDVRLAVVKVVL